jgi:uncharacterized protein (DUF885 family)
MKLLAFLLAGATLMCAQTDFDQLVDRYFDDQFRLNPSNGTAAGFHQYDSQLEDYSAKANQERIAVDRKYLAEFEKVAPSPDREIVIAHIHGDLLSLESIRPWQKNPDYYSSSVTSSIFGLISRKFAPPADRLKSVIAREKLIPHVFDDARALLKNPPKIYTEIAIEQLPGNESFFTNDVPLAFKDVTDAALLAEFKTVNQQVIDSLKSYETFLKSDLLAKSHGDYRIGAENFRKKLAYDEMIDIPLDRVLKIGYDNLRANQRALIEVAKQIDPTKTPRQVSEQLFLDHPAPDQLLQSFRDTFNSLIAFINANHIITIPSEVRPILEESPPFMRAVTTASMDTPGPYEKVATEAYFNVTLPEKSWSAAEVQDYMASFNKGTIISTSVHEAYPGHYVQLLWFQKVQSKVRKLINCGSNVEGWAHYTEQMMLDEGYDKGDLLVRLGQLQDALLRNSRYIVGIQMHTGHMTYQQAVDFFMKEGYTPHSLADRETKRGTNDPTYLVYTIGKLQIMKLREDYKQAKGSAYSLEEFHNTFMQQGGVPVKIIRQFMLGNDSPTL